MLTHNNIIKPRPMTAESCQRTPNTPATTAGNFRPTIKKDTPSNTADKATLCRSRLNVCGKIVNKYTAHIR